jgi:hypothetical protein
MAGAGYKLFNTGDVLTAAQVNTYLQEQTVMVFASSAARTSALSGVLAEGMVSYLQDTNAVEVYNGSAWVGVSGAGDVTEVQAGTGISVASGTGPIPVVTNTMATAIDAEGDLIIGDAADAFQRLAIGSNTHVLTVDTSVDGKIKWAAPSSGSAAFVGCIGTRTSGTQSITAATITAITMPSEEIDTDAFHDTSTNTSRFTIPSGKGGKYFINVIAGFNQSVGTYGELYIRLNGSTYTSNGFPTSGNYTNTFSGANDIQGNVTMVLSAADYVEVAIRTQAGIDISRVRISLIYLGA